MSTYQKAYIFSCKDGSPVTAGGIAVQFNPSEITIEEAVDSGGREDDAAGLNALMMLAKGHDIGRQWPQNTSSKKKETNELTLSTTLFFNTLENINQENYEDVREYIKQLYPYTNRITPDNKGKNRRIEQICFSWGSLEVVGLLTQMSVHYTMFAPSGRPVRAEVSIRIVGDYYGEQKIKKSSGKGEGSWSGFGSMGKELNGYSDPGAFRASAGGGNPRKALPRNK